ncbi:phage holin family protein [Leifsonia kafniensis]
MTDAPTPSEEQAAKNSLGDLLGEVTRDVSTLMRQELELAKAELRESATRTGKAAGMYGAAAYGGMMAVLFLSIAAWWGLGYLIGNAWSAVVIAVVWAVVALILYLSAQRKMKTVKGAPQTVDTLKEIPETLRRNEENR